MSRRSLLKTTAGTAAALGLPMPFIRPARAAGRDTLVFASAEPVTGNWDPTSHTSLGQINFEGFVFGQLFRTPMRPDNPTQIVWELATSQTLIDPYTLEYKLRDGVTFHNGASFSAEDVKATMEYATDPSRPASALYPGQCEVEVVDRLTARVHTKKFGYPASAFQFTGGFMAIMSKDDVKNPSVLAQRPNGTGPFKFVDQKGNTTYLDAFDKYYQGQPILNHVQFAYIGDATTRVLGLLSGNIDVLQRLEPEQYATLQKDQRVTVSRTLSTENKYLHFRCNKKPFDNRLVRLAACHAIDRSQIMDLMGVAGGASSSYISPLKFGYETVPNYPEFDEAKCQALLAQAGFPKGQGLPEIDYITSTGFYPKTKDYGELITAMMQEQGFNVKLNVMETGAWGDVLYQHKGQVPAGNMIDCGWSTGTPEPDMVLRAMFYSKAGPAGGIINGIQDADIDAALSAERNETDLGKRRTLVGKATEVIASKAPSLSLFTSVNLNATRAGLENLYIYPNGPMDAHRADFKSA
ncbi:MAG TPA: ABC transporter substrate-binding protein [Acidisoma sp.]|uniref:ABC transporter substrate-binding protein n=1 Tax=Acidisoma sp. TaxID=1872115 RepID=UPI002C5D6B0B|nr:ABC transporter substrate-binding protein [Acidisoma sp.]HTI02551.1 ABC transporter substrate-binding protein [Acidisoma sp.]